jgi:DNA-binding response OmpR family regulator
MRLLLIEDNHDLVKELADFFESQGDIIDTAADGITGLHLAVVNDYDAIVLDLGLPGINGLELCKHLREKAQKWLPVLMLTARDTVSDRISGFEHGADDYLIKPFSLKELKLRLEALTRRHSSANQKSTFIFSDLSLNSATREVKRAGQLLELTLIEFKILELLIQHAPNVVSRQDIEYTIWDDNPPDGDALRVHIHHLRQAIDTPFTSPALLHTNHGVGYQLK